MESNREYTVRSIHDEILCSAEVAVKKRRCIQKCDYVFIPSLHDFIS